MIHVVCSDVYASQDTSMTRHEAGDVITKAQVDCAESNSAIVDQDNKQCSDSVTNESFGCSFGRSFGCRFG